MENNKDYEKRLGRRLREAYLKDYEGPAMSREDFHRLIEAAEKKKKHKRNLIGLAAACVALCLVFGGFMAGMSMRESASAGKNDETKTVQQGGSMVIGNGASENDQNVGVSTKTYTNIEDIPENLREQIRFLDSDEFELEKVKVREGKKKKQIRTFYRNKKKQQLIIKEDEIDPNNISIITHYEEVEYKGINLYKTVYAEENVFAFLTENEMVVISVPKDIKIEVVLDDLLKLE